MDNIKVLNNEPPKRLKVLPIGGEPLNLFNRQKVQDSKKPFEPLNLSNTITDDNLDVLREKLLSDFRKKQPFRVAIGKGSWFPYNSFNPEYNLREILDDEVVIEFDTTDNEIVCRAIGQTCINLDKAGIKFEYWEHGGKSPHIHIHDLPIIHLDVNERRRFKKIFIRKYVPLEYLPYVDITLTGIHLIALEWAKHWKGCYGVKKLLYSNSKGRENFLS